MIRIRRIVANDFKQLQNIDIHLPPIGRFLIQGKNEAGKSTLFEALYFGLFGKGLTGRNTDDLIGYAREKARVEVWVEAHDRTTKIIKIERTLTRGKPQRARLTIERDGVVQDEVASVSAINDRVARELKLDGDALLNTCFVEQKKLDKLEGVDKDKRESSLMRLLNLDHLKQLEDTFKPTSDDNKRLLYLADKRELARARDELPRAQDELADVKNQLLLASTAESLKAALCAHEESLAYTSRLADLEREAVQVAQQERELAEVREAGQRLRELQTALVNVEAARDKLDGLDRGLAQARQAADQLPRALRQAQDLGRLALRWRRLDGVAQAREAAQRQAREQGQALSQARLQAEERDAERERIQGLSSEAARAEAALTEAQTRLKAFQERAALTDWREVYLVVSAPARAQDELAERQVERAALAQSFQAEVEGFLAAPPAGRDALLTAARALLDRLTSLFRRVDTAAYRAGYLEGSHETLARRAEADRKRLAMAEKRLRELAVSLPRDETEADTRLAVLAETVGERGQGELQAAADQALAKRSELAGWLAAAEAKLAQLERALRGVDVARLEQVVAAHERRAARAETVWARWELPARQATVKAGLTRVELERASGEAASLAQQLQRQAVGLADLERQREQVAAQVEQGVRLVAEMYPQVAAGVPDLPSLSPDLRASSLDGWLLDLRQRYQNMGGDVLKQRGQALQREVGMQREALRQAEQRLSQSVQAAQVLARQAGVADLLPDTAIDTLRQAHTHLAAFDLNLPALERERDSLTARIGALRDQQGKLEVKLGLGDIELDLAACEAEHDTLQRDLAVRERARLMVERGRRRIVEKVMPETMRHMQFILPQLTSGRYMLAQLTPDYKISVWDERAGDSGEFRQKDIFSGGCRDQLSLALRLSFALATLPAERGAAPSFIFLDEPLGAFDDERADALLALLTKGLVGQSFDQIFLISHVRVDPSAFTHRILLEGGRVIDHTLPDTHESPADLTPA